MGASDLGEDCGMWRTLWHRSLMLGSLSLEGLWHESFRIPVLEIIYHKEASPVELTL